MPLHPEILARINALGGDTRRVTGASLADDLASITFDTVLYPRPEDNLPWATGDDEEPIYGLDGYIAEHAATLAASPEIFYREMLAHFVLLYRRSLWARFLDCRAVYPLPSRHIRPRRMGGRV